MGNGGAVSEEGALPREQQWVVVGVQAEGGSGSDDGAAEGDDWTAGRGVAAYGKAAGLEKAAALAVRGAHEGARGAS